MSITTTKNITLPCWVANDVNANAQYSTDEEKMGLVIKLAQRNVLEQTGGPFAAAIFDGKDHKIISLGVNYVIANHCSISHAEILAIMFAEEKLQHYRLDGPPAEELILVSSAQPCLMCLGAIMWSGIKQLIYGASHDDVINHVGFDEGPLPANWQQECEDRDIEIIPDVLADEAIKVLKLYKENGGIIY